MSNIGCIEPRPLYDIDKYIHNGYDISSLTDFQKDLLLGRLNNENIKNFDLNPEYVIYNDVDIEMLYNLAFYLPDSDRVIKLMKKIKKDDHICLISDFDTDGITSCVVMEKSLELLGYSNVSTIVNKRKYGTGVTKYCLEQLEEINKKQKVRLIILSDHGSSNGKEYSYIQKTMIPKVDIILTDHHEVNYGMINPEFENGFPFVNPHRTDKSASWNSIGTYCHRYDVNVLKSLSGCAIAYLTMLLIAGHEDYKKLEPLLYLVGISTISDIMPLDNPFNRYFVNIGLKWMYKKWPKLVIYTLKNIKFTPKDLSFNIIPTINTGNRADREDLSYKYVHDDSDAILELEKINVDRKIITKHIYKEMLSKDDIEMTNTVIAMLDTSLSIAGNVASKIGEHFHKPTLIFNKSDNDILTASARGIIDGIDLELAFRKITYEDDKIIVRFGGHKMAAGCSIYKDKIDRFKGLFNKYIGEQLVNLDTAKHIYIDALVKSEDINISLYKSTEIIGPYGRNWEDVTLLSKLKIAYVIAMGDVSKIMFKTSKGKVIYGICLKPKSEIEYHTGKTLYVIFNLEIDVKNRFNRLWLRVIDLLDDIDNSILNKLRRYNG